MANQKVIMSFRIDEALREAAHAMADEEKRTTSNFMEVLIQREQERRNGSEANLETILMEVRRVWDFLLKQSQPKPRDTSESVRKQQVLDEVLELDLPETLSQETWQRWVIYRKKQRYQWDVETAKRLLDRWEAAETDVALDELVEIAMQRGWKDAVYEKPGEQENNQPHWFQVGIK